MLEEFKKFSQKYKTRIDEEEVINMLLDDQVRNYIIENDNNDFLACIASANSDKLREFYFNEKCITSMINLDIFKKVLYKSDFYPNKIKLFDNEFFFRTLTLEDNIQYTVKQIIYEMENNSSNVKLINSLQSCLYKIMSYLKLNFKNNIKSIISFMKIIPEELYEEFLDYILDDLKKTAKENKEMIFDDIFSNFYITNSCENTFLDAENVINKFKEINNLYYCLALYEPLINRSVDYKNEVIISEPELKRLKTYIFNDNFKEVFLKNFDGSLIGKLYNCFSDEVIDYFLDDNSLTVIDNNGRFSNLLSFIIPYDKLTKSKVFAKLLSKNYSQPAKYDKIIKLLLSENKSFNKSLFNLLNNYLELKDYSHFSRIFSSISSDKQLIYYKINRAKLLELNNDEIFKMMKKGIYEIFNDKTKIKNWTYSDYDLNLILDDKDSYSIEQIERIFSNKENIITILNTNNLEIIYKKILNLNNKKLNTIYMSDEIQKFLRTTNKLDKIYGVVYSLKTDISPLFNNDNLIDIGEKVTDEYQKMKRKNFEKDFDFVSDSYPCFFSSIPNIEKIYLLFRILNFYLKDSKYLPVYNKLIKNVNGEVIHAYLKHPDSKYLLTKAIQQYDYDISLILEKLRYSQYINSMEEEIFKERDICAIKLDYNRFIDIFYNKSGCYKLDEKILNDERFIEKFIDHPNCLEDLKLVTENKTLIKKLMLKIKLYNNMKNKIIKNLNDSEDDFKIYLKILINSNVDIHEIEFLEDMINVIIYNKNIKEVFFKYKNINLEKIKLEILDNVIKKSRENIVSSISNPLNNDIVYNEYELNNRKIVLPTIIYKGKNYAFLVRSMDADELNFNNQTKCYSTITEKNRSMYYGDSRIKFGYTKVNNEDIVQINSFDSISNNKKNSKYIMPYIKCPEWVTMKELNDRTLKNKHYNELRIKGKYLPDFVISYDEPDEETLKYSTMYNVPLVKILRKSYPNSIEQCEDPYSDLQ